MKCTQCQKDNLILIYFDNFNYLCELVEGKWVYKDPGVRGYYFSGRQASVRCQDCFHNMEVPEITEIHSPQLNHKEITFDLDQTLFFCEHPDYLDKFDFSFTDPENKYTYRCAKRPHLDKFIQFCLNKFDKINFFTAAVDWYAESLIESLNIPADKLGFIKTRKHTQTERPLSFEWELMKPMDHSLMVEDKPLVIKGVKNRIFKVKPFYPGPEEDQELLRVIADLSRSDLIFSKPTKFSGEVHCFLQHLAIPFTNISQELVAKILDLPLITREEMKKMQVHTQISPSYYTIENDKTTIEMIGLNFENYLALIKLLDGNTSVKALTKRQFTAQGNHTWSRKHRNF